MRSDSLHRNISMMLALILLFSLVPVSAVANGSEASQESETAVSVTTGLEGKTISVLGDSISTYQDYSNGAAAETTNSTIRNGAVYYPRSGFDVTAESTWWNQTAQALDMEILVNNSWSGSCILNTRYGTAGAYIDRCVQLHDDTGENAGTQPDIIAIFLGTNDYYTYPGTLGSYEAIDFDGLIQEGEEGYTYAQPNTSLEAYAITLHKISQTYPNAQVYCFTLLPRVNSTNQPTAFNADVCQLAQHFGMYIVDLYDCGISSDSGEFHMLMGDSLHPDVAGMDAITNAFVSALLKNSDLATHDVTFVLDGAVAMEGTTRTVINGSAFEATLAPLDAALPLEVTVTMGGEDITESCCRGNVVTIPAVVGEVVITAKPGQRAPMNFRWETKDDALVSITSGGSTANPLTMTHGTITDGVYSKTRFTMSQGISLRHDLPWCVEWKSSGTWTDTTDGALLFSEAKTSATADAYYFYRRHNNDFFALGTYTGGKYHNYGVRFAGTGIDTTAEHVFRLENRIASDGSNMVYLLVDGAEAGPLNHHYIGGTYQNETVDWVSGKDFNFSYMGTTPHTIGGCSLEYIQVWEAGAPETVRELTSFRWEYDSGTDSLISVTHSGNTENPLTMTHGTITDGSFAKTRFTLTDPVMLNHDSPWSLEWKASGTWTDTTDGALLFAEANASATENCAYLYRRHKNTWFALGVYENGKYHNYGANISGTGIDTTEEHVYRLTNRIADDGTNMVYLYVDGVEIGPMNHHYIGGTDQNETVDWVCGKDFRFSYMGTAPHTIGGGTLDYVQVWEKGEPAAEPEWEIGSIYASSGTNFSSNTRLRTVEHLLLADYTGISVGSGYSITYLVYDVEKNYLGNGSETQTGNWLGDGVGISFEDVLALYPDGVYFRVVLCASNGAEVTLEDVEASGISFRTEEEDKGMWEQGTIASATGVNNDNTTRLRTVDYLLLEDYGGVGINRGYTMTNFVYDQDYNYLGTSSWLGSGIGFETEDLQEKYPEAVYFRIALRTDDSISISVTDVEATGVTFYGPGEDVPVRDDVIQHTVVGNIGSWQDGAIFGGKLFVFNGVGSGAVYDLDPLTRLGTISLDRTDVLIPHSNSVCFGNTYYAEGDQYPLLYINVYNNYASSADRMEGTCCVYRLTEADGVFTTDLVQVIRIGFAEDLTLWKSKENNGDTRPYGNFVVDTDNHKLYAYVMRDANSTTRFFCFDLPTLTDGAYNETYGCNVVTLEQSEIETYFDTGYFNYLQGGCYFKDQILSVEGFTNGTLRIVDLDQQKLSASHSLGEAGLLHEPEVLCIDPATGIIYYAAADGILRKLTIPGVETEHTHSYTSAVTEPTCTERGYTTYTCECGDSYVDDYADAAGHDYADGICTLCGVRQTSAFQILDTRSGQMETFTYEVGMTWKEWLNSKYNTGMGSCIAIDVSAGPDILGGNPYMDIFVNGTPADYDDVICEEDNIELIKYP